MRIAELRGEKTVKTLAMRLLAKPSTDTPQSTQAEMEAALLRLNPQLNQIGDLENGVPIVVPDKFALAPGQSISPAPALTSVLLDQVETNLAGLRAAIKESAELFATRNNQAQSWLQSPPAEELVRQSPKLKSVLSNAASAAEAAAKEQSVSLTAELQKLDSLQSQLAKFRDDSRK
jgi:hypothetical protein